MSGGLLLDDFLYTDLMSSAGMRWQGVSDRVMGGVSRENVELTEICGRRCLRLRGDVRLDNNGGFIQMALDLAEAGGTLDASPYTGVSVDVWGNGEEYDLRLRTADCVRPWQSYRTSFIAEPAWSQINLPFESFVPHRLGASLDLRCLRRLGFLGIGRAFAADLAVAKLSLSTVITVKTDGGFPSGVRGRLKRDRARTS